MSEYLALGDGPPASRGFHVSCGTQELLPEDQCHLSYGTITLFGCPFQEPSDMT